MNFEDYIAKKDPKHHHSLRLVYEQFMAAHPGMQLVKKWGLPVFMLKKNIGYLDVQKDRPLLGVMYAKDIPDIRKLLYVGNRKQIGHFYLDELDEARYAELLAVIEIAVSHDLAR